MTLVLSAAALLAAAVLLCLTLRRIVFLVAALFPTRRWDDDAATPSVALLVPACNEAAIVDSVLEAIATLEYPTDRLFVALVNDGSHDATGEHFRRWAANRPRTLTLDLPRSVGKFQALNQAIGLIPQTDVIAVCDADLRPHPEWLRRLVAPFADGRVGAAAAFISPANAESGPVARYAAVESWVHQLITSAAKDHLGLNPPTLGACAYRRTALEEVGLFDGGPGGDVRTSAALTHAGWRIRFVRDAAADNAVVHRWTDYWHQHLRWARNLFATAHKRGSSQTRVGRAAGVEGWIAATGYADRIAFLAAAIFAVLGLLPVWPLGVYLGVAGAEVAVALGKAGVGRRAPAYLLAATALFALDVAASLVAAAHHFVGRPRAWRQPQRDLSRSTPTAQARR